MTNAIVLQETGGPEQLIWQSVEQPRAGRGEVEIRHTAVGVNYIDTYMRAGLYPLVLPAILGQQGVGIVTAVGDGVERYAVGDRVAYGAAPVGAYAETRTVAEECLVPMPDAIDDAVCAATLLRGMTAEYLLFRLYAVQPGDTVLVHAVTGGTGSIVAQWAQHHGAKIIGTVGDPSRVQLAESLGCELVMTYDDPLFVEQVTSFTNGELCHAVYDSVGKDTLETSLACVRRRGMLVAYGNASGKPEPFDVLSLARQGSVYLTRPRLDDYATNALESCASAARFFDALIGGAIVPRDIEVFAMADAANAHRHLENRALLSTPVLTV